MLMKQVIKSHNQVLSSTVHTERTGPPLPKKDKKLYLAIFLQLLGAIYVINQNFITL